MRLFVSSETCDETQEIRRDLRFFYSESLSVCLYLCCVCVIDRFLFTEQNSAADEIEEEPKKSAKLSRDGGEHRVHVSVVLRQSRTQ